MQNFKIGNKTIGLDQPIFIAAEVGTTCNGDVETAKKLIDAAKDAGMDAVKFQIIDPDDKFSDKSATFTYKQYDGKVVTENLPQMLKMYVMSLAAWREIKKYGDKVGIIVFATPDHLEAVDLMEELDMPAYKIATWDATYLQLVRKVAKTGKPVILDLGASELEEVARIIKVIEQEKNSNIILLHCFHTPDFAQMNLRTVEYLRTTFDLFSGFSAPDRNNAIDYMTLPYMPVYIEKRLTLNRKDPHHHHAQGLEPDEMKSYVRDIRNFQKAIGRFMLAPTAEDLQQRSVHFRALVAKKSIRAGDTFTIENVACRRPLGNRLDPQYMDIFIGKKARINIAENEPFSWEAL